MTQEMIDNNPLLKLSFEFALHIIVYTEQLESLKRFTLSKQLFKSGTSIGANSMEAQSPESKADFVHKIKIAAKEAEEAQYWLLLCQRSSNYPNCQDLITELNAIQKILGSILKTAKTRNPLSYMWGTLLFLFAIGINAS